MAHDSDSLSSSAPLVWLIITIAAINDDDDDDDDDDGDDAYTPLTMKASCSSSRCYGVLNLGIFVQVKDFKNKYCCYHYHQHHYYYANNNNNNNNAPRPTAKKLLKL